MADLSVLTPCIRELPDSSGSRLLLPDVDFSGENQMLPHLVDWLVGSGRVRRRTRIAYEVPWLGRRVDLALSSGAGITTAFELKLGRFSRVLEQAVYNSVAFHRSWIVTGNRPRPDGLDTADRLGLGVLVVQRGRVEVLALARTTTPDPALARRARRQIEFKALDMPQ